MFSHVIVKTPCTAMVHGITGHPELGAPDYEKALEQHRAYIETLRQCGVDVTVLPADEAHPAARAKRQPLSRQWRNFIRPTKFFI